MKGAAMLIYFCHRRGGVLCREGEQVAAMLGREAAGWPSVGGRRKAAGPRLGRYGGFGPGEEGGCGGPRWAKRPERLGPAWEFPWKIQIGLPRRMG
jgi:hypothetical protein